MAAGLFMALSLMPVPVLANEGLPDIAAESYVVMDADTGQVLMGRDANRQLYPASITKIVTVALAQQALNQGIITLDTQLTVSDYAVNSLIAGASTVSLVPGEVVSVRDMIYATQLRSANDAANVLAEHLGGSVAGFAQMMNDQVASLGLTGTHFTNPHGLPDDNHYTTAYDMAALTRWAWSVEGFGDWFGARSYLMQPTNLWEEQRGMSTQNYIMWPDSRWYYEGITGSKNGYTGAAGYTLATTASRGDMNLIVIVMKCALNDQKYIDTTSLFDYCFENFTRVSYTPTAMAATDVPVYGGGGDSLGDITVEGYSGSVSFLLMNRLGVEDVRAEYSVPESYIIGNGFTPLLTLSLPNSAGQYETLLQVPLEWSGIEEVLAANTSQAQGERGASTGAVLLWVLAGVFAAFVLLIAGRILYVRSRRRRRAKQRAQRQISFEQRRRIYLQEEAARQARQAQIQVYRTNLRTNVRRSQ